MSVTSPDGQVEHFGPESSIWTEAMLVAGSHGSDMARSSTACQWSVWFIGVLQTSSWYAAIGILALNPPAAAALTAVVTLGYGAFWNWVSTKC